MRGNLHVGDLVRFGSYLSQSLLWRVIDVDEEGKALLFSEDVIKMIGFDYGRPSHRHRGPFRSTMGSNSSGMGVMSILMHFRLRND